LRVAKDEQEKKTTEEIRREKQLKINKETAKLIFNGEHKDKNKRLLQEKGVTEKQIQLFEKGNLSHNHDLKDGTWCFHITAKGSINATSNKRVIYRKSDGKIMKIEGH